MNCLWLMQFYRPFHDQSVKKFTNESASIHWTGVLDSPLTPIYQHFSAVDRPRLQLCPLLSYLCQYIQSNRLPSQIRPSNKFSSSAWHLKTLNKQVFLSYSNPPPPPHTMAYLHFFTLVHEAVNLATLLIPNRIML